MWLIENAVGKNSVNGKLRSGRVVGENKDNIEIKGTDLFRNVVFCTPFGMASIPADDSKVFMMTVEDSKVCVGAKSEDKGLEPGEIMLFSKGGANILLSNDGKVYINGKE